MRLAVFLSLLLSLAACVRPNGEWRVTAGADFHDERLDRVVKGVTAGQVVQALGVPLRSKPDEFVYAVRKVREIEQSYGVYARPATQEITIEAKIALDDGYVRDRDVKRYERIFPRD